MAEITPATPIEMIVYYAGLRDEYESATGQEKDEIFEEAKEIFKNDVYFDEEGNYVEVEKTIPMLSSDKQESFWYEGQVAIITKGEKTFSVEATGMIRIYIDPKSEGEFEESPRLDKEDAVKKAADLGFVDDDIHNTDKVHWEMNNWFAIRELDENGDAHDDCGICHIYADAIEQAVNL